MRITNAMKFIVCGLLALSSATMGGCSAARSSAYFVAPSEEVSDAHKSQIAVPAPAENREMFDHQNVLPRGLIAGRNPSSQPSGLADLIAPQSLSSNREELWVIEKKPAKHHDIGSDIPGTGSLLARLPDKPTETVSVPLKHTDVKAEIAGYIATVDVTQQFHNPYTSKIEAVYVFPLPENAAVNEFIMTVGSRKIRGIIREREEAQRIYTAAKSQGYVASLLTQERPNVFTQSVANIEPGKEIDINIKYFQTLSYSDGWYQFIFPMVVGPRFNPPGSTTGIGAVARGSRSSSGQSTEVQYLAPHERNGHDIALAVHIDAGVPIEKIECNTHEIQESESQKNLADVKLAAGDSIPNRDFVLRYKVAGKTIRSAVMVQRDRDHQGGYFAMMLFPPDSMANLPRKPLEMVFTIDVSGSQSGIPIAQEKAAVKYALTHMNAGDTFQVVRFGNTAQKLFSAPQPANGQNVQHAIRWVDALDATEGTMLVDGLRASLLFPHDETRLRYVTFLTDGFIGNEVEALSELQRDLGPSRIFSLGSGSATNRYLLESMARLGNGAAAYLGPRDKAEEVMSEFLNRISHPAMTDLSLDCGNAKVTDVYPQRLGDLYVGRPVIITGRFTGGGTQTFKVRGLIANEKREIPIQVNFDESMQQPAIAAVWARAKIESLAAQAGYEPNTDLPQQIRQFAIEYGLMSSFTAFVAADSTTKTSGDHGTTVAMPVPVPEGVRYDTTVTP